MRDGDLFAGICSRIHIDVVPVRSPSLISYGVSLIVAVSWPCYRPAAMKNPRCHAKTELLITYQIAMECYSRAVRELSRTIGNASVTDFDKINLVAIQARRLSQKARNDLNVHTMEHGC
jgi:hypothetical protein